MALFSISKVCSAISSSISSATSTEEGTISQHHITKRTVYHYPQRKGDFDSPSSPSVSSIHTSSSSPSSSASRNKSTSSLKGGKIAGIVIAVVISVTIIAIIGIFLYRRHQRQKVIDDEKSVTPASDNEVVVDDTHVDADNVPEGSPDGSVSATRTTQVYRSRSASGSVDAPSVTDDSPQPSERTKMEFEHLPVYSKKAPKLSKIVAPPVPKYTSEPAPSHTRDPSDGYGSV